MIKLFAILIRNSIKAFNLIVMNIFKTQFLSCGKNVRFYPWDEFSYDTIKIGTNVKISNGAKFSASNSYLVIKDNVMFGPDVIIMAGDHNTSVIGEFMINVKFKNPHNDAPIIIEEDCWIGAGVIILKGVTIGRGSIIGAGSIVTRSIAPYSVAVGSPARVVKKRMSDEEILNHEYLLYLKHERFVNNYL
jgi:acetyltransferase-like isoleucine patch superfamily enzyme